MVKLSLLSFLLIAVCAWAQPEAEHGEGTLVITIIEIGPQPKGSNLRPYQPELEEYAPACLEKLENVPESERPSINLRGESHGEQADKRNKPLVSRAAKGLCVVGLEGAFCGDDLTKVLDLKFKVAPTKKSKIYGIDHEFTHQLSINMLLYMRLVEAIAYTNLPEQKRKLLEEISPKFDVAAEILGKVKTTLGAFISERAISGEAWKMVKRPFKDPQQERVAKVFDANLERDLEAARDAVLNLPQQHPWNSNHENVKEVVSEWLKAYGKLANSKKYKNKLKPHAELTEILDTFVQKPGDDTWSKISLSWRDPFLARNIAKLYCDSLDEQKGEKPEPLEVLVGANHLNGVGTRLAKMFRGKIEVSATDYSFSDRFEIVQEISDEQQEMDRKRLEKDTKALLEKIKKEAERLRKR